MTDEEKVSIEEQTESNVDATDEKANSDVAIDKVEDQTASNEEVTEADEDTDVTKETVEDQNTTLEEVPFDEEACKKYNSNMLKRILVFVISSLLYIAMKLTKTNKDIDNLNTGFEISKFMTILEIIVYIVAVIGLIGIILYKSSPKFKEKFDHYNNQKKNKLYDFIDWLSVVPFCLVVVMFCFSYIFFIVNVSGTSMNNTYYDGEKLLVLYDNKYEFGDVVIINVNKEDNLNFYFDEPELYIKRIIGVPGDTVTWEKGVLTINGNVITEDYLSEDTKELNGFATNNNFSGYFSYIDDEGNTVNTSSTTGGLPTIPEGYYFVMGDNRGISNDSRKIGLIKAENIIGTVKTKLW